MLLSACILMLLLCSCLCSNLTFYVAEEQDAGTLVGDIAANLNLNYDKQTADTSLVSFNLIGIVDLFNVTKTGKLYTTQKLDAESLCAYDTQCFKMLRVIFRENKKNENFLKIKIVIQDVNDHSPVFPKAEIYLRFLETDGEGTKKFLLNAIDKDVGEANSQISYQIVNDYKGTFDLVTSKRVDGTDNLEIVLREMLDREVQETYKLQIIATDNGVPPRKGKMDVQISVIDANDNPPIFSQNIYNVFINSSHRIDKPVFVLSAHDLDYGNNSKVSYKFGSKTSEAAKHNFRLNEITGEIYHKGKFSLGENQNYKLFVEARDGGKPFLSSITLVRINIVSQHNNPPVIEISFVSRITEETTVISEDIKVGNFIAFVKVTDDDTGENGEVECQLNHPKFQLQTLGSKEYKITVKEAVDRETKSDFSVTMTCEDNGSPALRSIKKFSVKVTDVNDVQPKFVKDSFRFLIKENESPNFPVGYMEATDPDEGEGGKLSYLILNNHQHLFPFKISNGGFISTTRSLDREIKDSYQFQVLVKDNGTLSLNNTANVTVEIMDVNDNAPYFTSPDVESVTLNVHYLPQSNNEITVFKASDKDTPRNAFLKYGIYQGNDKKLFALNSRTGVLSFARMVYQNDAGEYELVVIVEDSGIPVLSATASATLRLTVSNDAPKIQATAKSSDKDWIDMNWVIIIVAGVVIVSVAIVISVTVCIIKYCKSKNRLSAERNTSSNHSQREMSQLISDNYHPATMVRNLPRMHNTNDSFIDPRTEFFHGVPSQTWRECKSPSSRQRGPIPTPAFIPQVEVIREEKGVEESQNITTPSTLKRDHRFRGNTINRHYEEIPDLPT
ncbi:protocadherin beta-4 isoform X1 [Octopus bimaculoides]|uniref:Cadherin domain-containing protein n=1 Tax=Octopus bimaculoides TaxID=37653 RepID=A0A0L8H5L3_OCTBM|nr:protocadherin beta-4 isoform X1 [Octopus bimaculoides]XP_014775551.1 protocadherin beta-4 isoform X1 [Octopus bimaculoides]XP_052829087.1 protocadherin beta-4 isoform X1 [Octopus bimaculoides]XP_052829088.1 protocadherin beta-4 isoform X1 [Octopus bimaculoides]|eukprot:XP_014775550.1 PREDICTED: protocadherin beta-3-like isoform X1 [Octopus bimaculoides]